MPKPREDADPAGAQATASASDPASLTDLLDAIAPRDPERAVTLREILTQVGGRSFAPVILVPALILVSPLSAIPGSPTLGMLIIVTVTLQALLGRGHLWLPDFLMRREIAARRLQSGLDWLKRPAAFIDRKARNRLQILVTAPLNRLVHLAILCITLPWPLLEPLPGVTTLGAASVSLMAIGLMLRDGLFVVFGFCALAALATGGMALWQGLL